MHCIRHLKEMSGEIIRVSLEHTLLTPMHVKHTILHIQLSP